MELNKKKLRSLLKNKRHLIRGLGIKTKALWIASDIIQKNVEPKKTQTEIYEILKTLGKAEYEDNLKKQAEKVEV